MCVSDFCAGSSSTSSSGAECCGSIHSGRTWGNRCAASCPQSVGSAISIPPGLCSGCALVRLPEGILSGSNKKKCLAESGCGIRTCQDSRGEAGICVPARHPPWVRTAMISGAHHFPMARAPTAPAALSWLPLLSSMVFIAPSPVWSCSQPVPKHTGQPTQSAQAQHSNGHCIYSQPCQRLPCLGTCQTAILRVYPDALSVPKQTRARRGTRNRGRGAMPLERAWCQDPVRLCAARAITATVPHPISHTLPGPPTPPFNPLEGGLTLGGPQLMAGTLDARPRMHRYPVCLCPDSVGSRGPRGQGSSGPSLPCPVGRCIGCAGGHTSPGECACRGQCFTGRLAFTQVHA